jgi:hypothetical protein
LIYLMTQGVLFGAGAIIVLFIAPGAEAFKRDLPDAEIHLLDAGHLPWTRRTTTSRVASTCRHSRTNVANAARGTNQTECLAKKRENKTPPEEPAIMVLGGPINIGGRADQHRSRV